MTTYKINDGFWNKRIEVTRTSTLPSMYSQMKQTGRWDFLRLKYDETKDTDIKPHIFWDSDLAKFTEGVCNGLKYIDDHESPEYKQFIEWIDDAVNMVVNAQQEDGYINSYFTTVKPKGRWKNLAVEHELYCAGHLLEFAVTHYQCTGSTKLLNCLSRYIDYINHTFGPGEFQTKGYPGHPEIELALVRLLDIKPNDEKILNLLKYFIDQRGYNKGEYFVQEAIKRGDATESLAKYPVDKVDPKDVPFPETRSFWYMQAHDLIKNQKEILGHSVRAVYLLAGVQGLYNITGDKELKTTVQTLWRDMVDTKMHIIGGIGSIKEYEGFGEKYDLRWDCYDETCASIAILFLGKRMLLDELNYEVAQIMERALYNDILCGISINGKAFYYDQPIVGMDKSRSEWFECSCCPPNVSKLFNSLEHYVLTVKKDLIAINMFIGTVYKNDDVDLVISTEYPIKGGLTIDITSGNPIELAIRKPDSDYTVSIEGSILKEDGYIYLPKKKYDGETIAITFDLPVKIIKPDPKVKANEGCLAVERGPFVYALENSGFEHDGDKAVDEAKIEDTQKFTENIKEIESCEFVALDTVINDKKATFVPYFATGNVNPGEYFRVWIAEDK
ncbi:glycoside hydrolase family 127 protein [[Candida] arabinofermentans NRRL YB-2248]|uniref:Glycoside hydrolase family 127 protein n=1 Tax=[Candida] arabinofermentans NRRL YB-2248 TaxID=983967 RepID=A0A1E4T719_9ASCO|nr:glycoside hydrolase family 127 protein [[Candida] arabinofermentans NRRL YB-2248]